MKLCDWSNCPNWAQWRGTWPDTTIRIFCNIHKEAYQKQNEGVCDIKFSFAGVFPDGVESTEHTGH